MADAWNLAIPKNEQQWLLHIMPAVYNLCDTFNLFNVYNLPPKIIFDS